MQSAERAGAGAYATQQINQAYAVMLSSHFQAFCRELHTECAFYFVNPVAAPNLRSLLRNNLLFGRRLDRGNPNVGNIGADFNRFDLSFWSLCDAHRPGNSQRRMLLEELMAWRNAIAHQDFAAALLRGGRAVVQLAQVQSWRRACDVLADSFDAVMSPHIRALTGTTPW